MTHHCLRCNAPLWVPDDPQTDTVLTCKGRIEWETKTPHAVAYSSSPCRAKHVIRNGNLLLVHEEPRP